MPSVLNPEDIDSSFQPRKDAFGASSVHFSPSGSTAVIKDDTPSAASADGHRLIVIRPHSVHPVMITSGPTRPGILIEEWPAVAAVHDDRVSFRWDGQSETFDVAMDVLLRPAEDMSDGNRKL